MGGFNADVQKESFHQWMYEYGLQNPLNTLHGTDSPPTYNGGKTTIDAILTSVEFDPFKGGYLAFGHVPGDHRRLWVDQNIDKFIGYKPPPVVHCKA